MQKQGNISCKSDSPIIVAVLCLSSVMTLFIFVTSSSCARPWWR